MASQRKPRRPEDDLVDWFTVSYKSIYIVVLLLLAIGAGAYYHYFGKPINPKPAIDVPSPTVTTARFTSIEGNVKVKPVGVFDWYSADPSMVLRKSDLVRTGPGASAEITFFDGTVVHVRPDSLITIEDTSEDFATKKRRVAWHISSGEVNFQTGRRNVPGSATEISTPTLRTTAGELTDGGIKVDQSGDSDVKVYRGSTRIETKIGEKLTLGASEALKVDAAGKAGRKQVLLEAPVLQAPMHQTEIAYPDPLRATTLLLWKPVIGSVSYHVMVDYSPYFNRPLVDQVRRDSSVELRGLETGKYYWRVAALDKDAVEGAFSTFARFTIVRKDAAGGGEGAPPPLVIESIDVRANILQVKGRTEPGATVTVNDQRVDVQGDGSFNEFIQLDKGGRQLVVVRSTSINGGINEQKRPIVVTF
jgi:FecR protein